MNHLAHFLLISHIRKPEEEINNKKKKLLPVIIKLNRPNNQSQNKAKPACVIKPDHIKLKVATVEHSLKVVKVALFPDAKTLSVFLTHQYVVCTVHHNLSSYMAKQIETIPMTNPTGNICIMSINKQLHASLEQEEKKRLTKIC